MASQSHILDLRKKKAETAAAPVKAEELSIAWQAPEFVKIGSSDWLFGVVLVAAGLFVWAIWSLNFLFALFLLLATISLIAWDKKPPKVYEFKVGREGVWIGEKFWPMDELESFWLFRFPDSSLLSLSPRAKFVSNFRLPLPQDSEEEALAVLRNYLPEVEENYSLVDLLADRLHF